MKIDSQRASFSEICAALRNNHRILVASHYRPDGDALGSVLAAALWLQAEGHAVTAWNEDGVPSKFSYLPESSLISKPAEEPQEFDAILVLDTAVKSRLGPKLLSVARAPLWLAIDHHVSNDYFADKNYVDAASPATGQILAEGFLSEGITITPAMALNLYAAISTDTGSFQYGGTTERTFEVAAALVRAGVSVGKFSQAMYGQQPRRRLELLRHALVHAKFFCNDCIASFALTIKDAVALGIMPEDTEGIIDHLRSVEKVIAAAFFEELSNNQVRLSLRSNDASFDASAFCAQYGGGGHRMAAGATLQGSIGEVEESLLTAMAKNITC